MHDFLLLLIGFGWGMVVCVFIYYPIYKLIENIESKYNQLLNVIQLWQRKI